MNRRLLVAPLLVALLVAACGSESPSPSGGTTRTPSPVSGEAGPTPSPSPIAAGAGAFGEFEPIVLKGKGNKTVEFEIPEDAISLAALSHPGKGAFQVEALGADGKVTQTLVKTSGKYAGRRAVRPARPQRRLQGDGQGAVEDHRPADRGRERRGTVPGR